jgi:hypothetical protein
MNTQNTKFVQFTKDSKLKILINIFYSYNLPKLNADVIEVRKLYSGMRKSPTHLVQSTEIATACECQHLFKLSYPYGVLKGDKDYLTANTVHDILSLIINGPIIENWEFGIKDYKNLATKIIGESSCIIQETIRYIREVAKQENRHISDDFDERVNDLTYHLIESLTRRIMKKYHQPKRATTEITISNIQNYQEGRIDALLEYSEGYALLDWKTYSISNTISAYEKWQLISNLLLANYRYTGSEENWKKYLFSSIVHYSGAYFPKFDTITNEKDRILVNRNFAYSVLCGQKVHAEKPKFCPVCDNNGEGSKECKFYRQDSISAYEGKIPAQYDKMRRQFFGKRYEILKERGETNLHKYVLSILTSKYGESLAISKLEKLGIIDTTYRYNYQKNGEVYFIKDNNENHSFLEPRKIVRIIGKEHGIPLLACISEQASVTRVLENSIVLNFRSKIALQRAEKQLFHLPMVILRDELNLTRIMLAPIHEFHKLAADIFIHKDEVYNDNTS